MLTLQQGAVLPPKYHGFASRLGNLTIKQKYSFELCQNAQNVANVFVLLLFQMTAILFDQIFKDNVQKKNIALQKKKLQKILFVQLCS